nr:hypothetical protein GCM10020093_105520 [Planobispora longispora]
MVDLVALVERLGMMLRPTSETNRVTLSVRVSEAASEALVDEAMLTKILRNLLSNGLKFTEDGEVRLDVTRDASTHEMVFTVTDTGIGIPEEHLERVFEEFYQVPGPIQARAKGTGLGLPYARRLAEAMGGTLQLSSGAGAGTTAVVRLPDRPDGDTMVNRVLIADDDDDFRATVRRMLTGFAARVDEAHDGLEALEAMSQELPDLVLVDLLMPRMDGAALLARMAEDQRLRGIPVVIVTVATSQQYPQTEHAVLSKHDMRRDNLLEAVRHALERRGE